jgi:hypothetical protein
MGRRRLVDNMKHIYLSVLALLLFISCGVCAYRTGYDLGSFMPGLPDVSAIIRLPVVRPIILPAGLPQLVCTAKTAPTSAASVSLNKVSGGITSGIGFLDWNAASTTCHVTGSLLTSDFSFVSGDVVEEVFPASPDATFADITIGLPAIRQ